MSKESNVGLVFVGGLIAGTAIMAVGYGISFDPGLWLNQAGLAEIAIGLATLTALVVGGVQASRSYWLNRSAAHSSRFADAARLLDGEYATRHAGVALTEEIALENPETYGMAAIRSLAALAQRTAAELMGFAAVDDNGRVSVTKQGKLPPAPAIMLEAFVAACKLITIMRPPQTGPDHKNFSGQVAIQDLFFSSFGVFDCRFESVFLGRSVIYRTTFTQCDFRHVKIHACFAGRVIFKNCDVSGLEIMATDRLGNLLQTDSPYAPYFLECTGTEKGTINRAPIAGYVAERRLVGQLEV